MAETVPYNYDSSSDEENNASSDDMYDENYENESNVSNEDAYPIECDGWSSSTNFLENEEEVEEFELKTRFKDFDPEICNPEIITSKLLALKVFLSDDLIQKICKYTNQRAESFIALRKAKIDDGNLKNVPKRALNDNLKVLGLRWQPIDPDTLWTFFGLLLVMTVWKAPAIQDYWSLNMFSGVTFCSEVMSKNRFRQILKFLRFCDSQKYVTNNPASRVSEFISEVVEKSTRICDPGFYLSVNESLLIKRQKSRLKLCMLCPSSPNLLGYTCNLVLNFGIKTYSFGPQINSDLLKIPNIKKPQKIVLMLLSSPFHDMLGQGRHVTTNDWYTSVNLANILYSHRTYITGTILPNRGVPKLMKDLTLDINEIKFVKNDNILIAKHRQKQNKHVHVLSTKCRAGNYSEKITIKKNGAVIFRETNEDRETKQNLLTFSEIEEISPSYDISRKSMTWFKSLSLHIVSLMVLNSKVMYYNIHNVPREETPIYSEYLSDLAHEILNTHSKGYKKLNSQYGTIIRTNDSKNPMMTFDDRGVNAKKRKMMDGTFKSVGNQTNFQPIRTIKTEDQFDLSKVKMEVIEEFAEDYPYIFIGVEQSVGNQVHKLVKSKTEPITKPCRHCHDVDAITDAVETYCVTCTEKTYLHPDCHKKFHSLQTLHQINNHSLPSTSTVNKDPINNLPYTFIEVETVVENQTHKLVISKDLNDKKPCIYCYKTHKQSPKVQTHCVTCLEKPYLHPTCFKDYHSFVVPFLTPNDNLDPLETEVNGFENDAHDYNYTGVDVVIDNQVHKMMKYVSENGIKTCRYCYKIYKTEYKVKTFCVNYFFN